MTARVDPELAGLLDGDPSVRLEAIVMSSRGLDELLAALPREVKVTHKYRLIGSVAVIAPAGALRKLAASSAVASMEPVRGVTHC